MTRFVRRAAVRLAFLVACAGMPACEGFLASSKVAQGQRYQADDSRYDPYFDNVHQQQVAAASWPDERKSARRSLVATLALTPRASDDTIVSATRERAKKLGPGGAKLDLAAVHVTPTGANDGPLFAAVEETARLELDRARKLKAAETKLEDLSKHGEELRKSAQQEAENRGADKADEKKVQKSRELRNELGGAVDEMHSLARDAAKRAREAQDFLDDLGRALEGAEPGRHDRRAEPKALPPPPPKPVADPPKEEAKKADPPKAKPAAPPPPAAKPKPADTPPPPPPPAPKPPPADDVFNP